MRRLLFFLNVLPLVAASYGNSPVSNVGDFLKHILRGGLSCHAKKGHVRQVDDKNEYGGIEHHAQFSYVRGGAIGGSDDLS